MSKKYKQPKHIVAVRKLKNDLIEGVQEELSYRDRNEIDLNDYIFEFVDSYAVYYSDQIDLVNALMKHPSVDIADVDEAIEESTDIGQLYFRLAETYLSQNVDEREVFEFGELDEDDRELEMTKARISDSRGSVLER